MIKMKRWLLMVFFLSFLLGCNPIKGMQEVREKANKEMKIVVENINGYVQRLGIASQRAERACYRFIGQIFQKEEPGRRESTLGAKKPNEQMKKGGEKE